jgi:hypothetical protein
MTDWATTGLVSPSSKGLGLGFAGYVHSIYIKVVPIHDCIVKALMLFAEDSSYLNWLIL